MICRTTVREFDGNESPTLHTAVFPLTAASLRFISWHTIATPTGIYADAALAPSIAIAWVPLEAISDEASSATEIDAALSGSDQIPLVQLPMQREPTGYRTDFGAGYPTVDIKGRLMPLAIRLLSIAPNTHGQLTLGWIDEDTPW